MATGGMFPANKNPRHDTLSALTAVRQATRVAEALRKYGLPDKVLYFD